MPTTGEFESFIQSWNLQHFDAAELLVSVSNPGNSLPPHNIWDNIIPTLIVLDELRSHFSKPIRITSTYRNEAYNKKIGGVGTSQHTAFTAIDFKVQNASPRKVKDVLVKWRDEGKKFKLLHSISQQPVTVGAGQIGQAPLSMTSDLQVGRYFLFSGGIGVYNSFVHLDTRGTNHIWYSDTQGDQSA